MLGAPTDSVPFLSFSFLFAAPPTYHLSFYLLLFLAMHLPFFNRLCFCLYYVCQNKSQAPVLRLVTHATLPGILVMMLPA